MCKNWLSAYAGFLVISCLNFPAWAEPNPGHFSKVHDDAITFYANATDDDLVLLDAHPELKSVDLGDGPGMRGVTAMAITNAGFAHVANCTNLERLGLSSSHVLKITDDALGSLEHLRQLRVISLGQTHFSNSALAHLAELPNLEELGLDSNDGWGDPALNFIAQMKNLRVLRFYTAPITDAGLVKIAGLSQLEDLQLGKSKVGDAGLETVGKFSQLRMLDLQYCNVSDDGAAKLKPLGQLTWLGLTHTAITGKALASLSEMTSLQSLFLEETQINDEGLSHLNKLTQLKFLYISHTRVTEAGLSQITQFSDLQALKLNGLPITDKGIELLVKMKSLKQVELNGTKITPAGEALLKQAGIEWINRESR